MGDQNNYWFPAKQYGWGWGPPRTWQGWAVLVTFAVLLAAGAFILLPDGRTLSFLGYAFALCALLTAVCYLKGERPRWRWGKK